MDSATIMKTVAVIGPMQVLGRIALTAWGKDFATLSVGFWATASLAASMLCLGLLPKSLPGLIAFAALYGAGNGVMTILRGTAIAESFGRERYAELSGALSLPAVIAKAAPPLILAAAWTWTGSSKAVVASVFLLLSLGTVGLCVAKAAAVRAKT